MKKLNYILGSFLLGASAWSQSITLTAPTTPHSVKEADNFLKTVINDPIDFDKRRDIQWEEGYDESSFSLNSNIWSMTTNASGSYIYPFFHGLPGAANIGKKGANFAMDTSTYTGFSIMSRMSNQPNTNLKALRWTRSSESNPTLDGSDGLFLNINDFVQTNAAFIPNAANEWTCDIVDLSAVEGWTSQAVEGVLFDRSTQAAIGTVEQYRWARFFDPSTGDDITISWDFANIVPQGGQVYAGNSDNAPNVTIYLDSDNSGFDGAKVARVPLYNNVYVNTGADSHIEQQNQMKNGSGNYVLETAALPPGDYYVYVKLSDNFGVTDDDIATSAYSAKITINAQSQVVFNNPSYTSGDDWASTVLGNPWDFNDSSDLSSLGLAESIQGFRNGSFLDGAFSATAFKDPDPVHTESESMFWMNIPIATHTIDTAKFKYLTFDMEIDSTNYTNISDKVTRGWVGRSVFWNEALDTDGTVTNDLIIYEGRNSYSLDLSKVASEPEETNLPNNGWTNLAHARYFRFDPTEVPIDTVFTMYDMKITANPEPDYTTNTFTVELTTSDKEGESATVEIYADVNRSDFDGAKVVDATVLAPGDHELTFSTADMAQGDYYLYAVMTDTAGNTTRTYSDIPLTIGTEVTGGNRVARYRLYNPNDGHHHYTTGQNEYNVLGTLGWTQEGISAYLYDDVTNVSNVNSSPYYRVYNPNSSEHFWTLALNEYNFLGNVGWTQEGVDGYMFHQEIPGSVPLYRLLNPNSGFHHWTTSTNENNTLIALGWVSEGIAGYVFTTAE